MAGAVAGPWSRRWLFRSLIGGAVFLAVWGLAVTVGAQLREAALIQGAAEAGLAVCLVIAAVTFVLEVVRRVTGV